MRSILISLFLACIFYQAKYGFCAEDDESYLPLQFAEESFEFSQVRDNKVNYTIRNAVKVTWFEAQVLCSIEDMKLASIADSTEVSNVLQEFFTKDVDYDDYWLAGNNFSGEWIWPGIQSNFTAFNRWEKNQPKHTKGKGECLLMQSNFRWKVDDCTKKYYYVCEK